MGAPRIPKGRTGEDIRVRVGEMTIYHGGAKEYLGSKVWKDEAGNRHVGPKPKTSGGGQGGGGGGGY